MNRRLQIALVVIFISFQAWGQKQAANWYFGLNAGMHFGTNVTVSLNNGVLSSTEGATSVSSASGELLFYTNGVTVWSKNHKVMANGSGLAGNTSTTQSSIIIPKPNSKSLYYIFTLDNLGIGNGLSYSEVDISANGGLGRITTNKNISIQTSVTEKLTAIPHANGKDYWVVVHGVDSRNFYAYQITENGVPNSSITSTVGSLHPNITGTMGYMKFSPDGKKIACAVSGSNFVEVLNFDNATGKILDPMRLDFSESPYGVEFSPNSQLLYISVGSSIFQYKIPPINNSGLLSLSEREIKSDAAVWALQLGLDRKIYVCKQSNRIGVITRPNDGSGNENFEDNSFALNNTAIQGLPNHPPNYYNENLIYVENACKGQDVSFRFLLNEPDSIQWDFGDNSKASALRPTHQYTSMGTFLVKAKVFTDGYSESFTRFVTIEGLPSFTLGADTILCKGQYLNFNFAIPNATYLWNNGKTSSARKITTPGVHHLAVTAKGCTSTDSVIVDYNFVSAQFSTNKFEQCLKGNSFEFTSTTLDTKTASWFINNVYQNDGKTSTISFSEAGVNKVKHEVTSNYGCIDSVVKEVIVNKSATASFTINAVNNCGTNNSFVFANTTNYSDKYSFEFIIEGNTIKNQPSITWNFSKEGEHIVQLIAKTAEGCEDIVEKKITVYPTPDADFEIITQSHCLANNSFTVTFNNQLRSFETLSWEIDGQPFSPSSTTFTQSFSAIGKHTIHAKLSNTSGCTEVITKSIEVFENPVADFTTANQEFSCLGTEVNFINNSKSTAPIKELQWDFGDNTTSALNAPVKVYNKQAEHNVVLSITDENQCSNSITKSINTYEKPDIEIKVEAINVCEDDNAFTLSYSNTNSRANISKILWQSIDGTAILSQNPAPVSFSTKGSFTIQLEVETIHGCKDNAATTVEVYPIPNGELEITQANECLSNNQFAVKAPIEHNGISIDNYTWDLKTNSFDIANNTASFSYDAVGNYTISAELTDKNGCVATLYKSVNVHPEPEFKITPKSGCVKTPLSLNIEGLSQFIAVNNWSWDLGNNTTSSLSSPTTSYDKAGNYTVKATATTDKGCRFTYNLNNGVTIHPNPEVSFEHKRVSWNFEETIIEFEGTSSIETDDYTWDFGNGQTSTTAYNRVDYSEAGYYNVTLSAKTDKGCVGSITKSILIVPPFDAYVPTSFTPNGDGINDFFGMEGVEFISTFDMRIFNRWGQEVFHSSQVKNQWNGKYGDTPLPPGLYTYAITINDAEGRPYEINGTIQLIR